MAKTRCGRRRCNTIATWGSSPPHTERSIEAPVGTPFRRGFVCTKEDGAFTREASAPRELLAVLIVSVGALALTLRGTSHANCFGLLIIAVSLYGPVRSRSQRGAATVKAVCL